MHIFFLQICLEKIEKWTKFNHFRYTIREALERLNELVDESDPDVNIPNIVHAFQTAEKIREDHPNLDWFHLTGLIHDLGKVKTDKNPRFLFVNSFAKLQVLTFFDEPQWAVVGDTFVVGCKWSPNIVYRDTSFKDNADGNDSRYK